MKSRFGIRRPTSLSIRRFGGGPPGAGREQKVRNFCRVFPDSAMLINGNRQ